MEEEPNISIKEMVSSPNSLEKGKLSRISDTGAALLSFNKSVGPKRAIRCKI